jgi:hypothetical protein
VYDRLLACRGSGGAQRRQCRTVDRLTACRTRHVSARIVTSHVSKREQGISLEYRRLQEVRFPAARGVLAIRNGVVD